MKSYIGAFEKTGLMAQPWVDAGYNAVCIDIDADEGNRDGIKFIRADMCDWIPDRKIVEDGIVFFAAFPPCDHLAVSGARWFVGKGGWERLLVLSSYLNVQPSGLTGSAHHT